MQIFRNIYNKSEKGTEKGIVFTEKDQTKANLKCRNSRLNFYENII